MANCAINEGKGIAAHNITPKVWQALLVYHILYCKNIDNSQYLLIELILPNFMDTNDTKSADKVLNNLDEALSIYRRNRAYDWLYWKESERVQSEYFFYEIHRIQSKYDYYEIQELFSWSSILLIAVFNGHYSICKFIVELLKDIYKASTWGETLIAVAKCGNNGLNVHRDDICRLLKNSFQIQ